MEVAGGTEQFADPEFSGDLLGAKVIGIGTDVIEVERVASAAKQNGFLARVYSTSELDYCLNDGDLTDLAAQRLATRFAAKEAALKAMGVGLGGVKFADIEISVAESGAPMLQVSGTAKNLAQELGIASWLVSLSHTAGFAQAFVVGLSDN